MDNIRVLYEDEAFLVVDKPPGLVVTPSDTQKEITLAQILAKEYSINLSRAGIVHRLDKDTSGIVVIARTEDVLVNLQSQFKERQVKKEYLALLHGLLRDEKQVNAPIERNPVNREKFMVSDYGREAVTKFIPEKLLVMSSSFIEKIFSDYSKIQLKKLRTMNYERYTLIKAFPLTGRTHQIRVHLKYIGFPLVGDEKYGGRKISRLDRRWCPRQFLHASKIEFAHPKTGERVVVESPLPKDLSEALSYLTEKVM